MSYCGSKYGYNSSYDTLSGQCKCQYGYVWNSTQTKCISEDESCQNQYGYNSKATLSGDKCECKYGYIFNNAGTNCISRDAACHELIGIMSSYDLLGDTCKCFSGYVLKADLCVPEEKNVITPPLIHNTPSISRIPSLTPTQLSTTSATGAINSNSNSGTNKEKSENNGLINYIKQLFYYLFR
jgi:hypothetical protein